MNKDNKIIYVEWVDSNQFAGWQEVEELKTQRAMHCFSVGWVVAESKDSITLATNITEENHPTAIYQCNGVMTIPKKAIVKSKVIVCWRCGEFLGENMCIQAAELGAGK